MKLRLFVITIIIFTAFAIFPANAALNQIHKDDTVFLGEEGLILNSDVFYTSGGVSDSQLAFYSSGNPATAVPDYIMTPSKNSFYVSSPDFKDREGIWYSYPNGSKNVYSAIYVSYPDLGLKLYAYRPGGESFDITNGKIVAGEALDFRIDSNLYPIFSRQGVLASDGGIDVRVKNQVGATFTSLYDCSGNPVKITGIHPSTSAYYAPSGTLTCVWDTGNSAYRTGSYTIRAECNVNRMRDNLGEITGATITDPIGTVQNTQMQTPTPTAAVTQTITKTPTAAKTQAPTPVITATETQTAKATTAATETAAKTQTQTESTAQLPQTPLGLFGVFMALALVSALAVIKRK